MKRTVIGILAHVDAGKTTLSEALLYTAGTIRRLGRVDHGNACLDHFALERQRGITIFAKQAVLRLPDWQATLLDTPGHTDFAGETERTLDVLDCAVLVISATDGVQSHTRTLWKLLRRRGIPTLIFVNKTDLPWAGREALLAELRGKLGDGVFDAERPDPERLAEEDEALLEAYLRSGTLTQPELADAVRRGTLFPCRFGAALRLDGTEAFLRDLRHYSPAAPDSAVFGAQIYKISRDGSTRLSHMKLTGGVLRPRDTLSGEGWSEKVTQLRIYTGGKFEQVEEAHAGDIVAAAGLSQTRPGQGLGAARQGQAPELEPVLYYEVLLSPGCEPHRALTQLRTLEEEEPLLHIDWEERTQQLRVQLMGPVQLEILKQLLSDRFGLVCSFGPGRILYRETIADTVEGVGHFEPLRHYAEVHLLLSPGERGSGITVRSACSEDELDRSWQRLILSHVLERRHPGVLIGAPVTDLVVTLASGRAHLKHTEGGDFRQATYRAIRQGLMQAESILLEPWYDLRLELPQTLVGRAITDLNRLGGHLEPPLTEGDTAVITGTAPAAALRDYPAELAAYSHGLGNLILTPRGYAPCPQQADVVREAGYDPAADPDAPPHSVFCAHGAGVIIPWDQVFDRMHLPSVLEPPAPEPEPMELARRYVAQAALDDQLTAIFERTYGPIRRERLTAMAPRPRPQAAAKPRKPAERDSSPEYLLVDGYNIIYAWDELRTLAAQSLEGARSRLIDRLRNYQSFRRSPVILVFDAYKVKGNPGSVEHLDGLDVVYTREAQTADQYIERATYDLSKKHRVRVATSDGLEQLIILGHGALRISASAFESELRQAEDAIRSLLRELNDSMGAP